MAMEKPLPTETQGFWLVAAQRQIKHQEHPKKKKHALGII